MNIGKGIRQQAGKQGRIMMDHGFESSFLQGDQPFAVFRLCAELAGEGQQEAGIYTCQQEPI